MSHQPHVSTKTIATLLALLTLISLLGLGYWLKQTIQPLATISLAIDPSCELRKAACTATLPNNGKLRFSITPQHIPLLQPLQLQVIMEAIEVSKIEVDIIGLNMDMGYNRTILVEETTHQFKGTTTLPVCIRNKMEWQANVFLHTKQGIINAPFRFHTNQYNSSHK